MSNKPKSRIRDDREKRGLTQVALADLCGAGILPPHISEAERGTLKSERNLHASLSSLRFNHREFCGELYGCHKTPSLPIFVDSSSLLEGRVAFGSAREATFWPSGRSSAGFRRLRGRAEFHQKRRNNAVYSNRCQAAGAVAPLPRQP